MSEEKLLKEESNIYTVAPVVDIFETSNEYTVVIEMPGVLKENIGIILTENELEISGNVVRVNSDNDPKVWHSEYNLYDYKRKFKIGNDIDRNSIEAHLDKGVLTVKLNKTEDVKPRKIEVKAS